MRPGQSHRFSAEINAPSWMENQSYSCLKSGMECKQSRKETVVHLHVQIFWVKMIFSIVWYRTPSHNRTRPSPIRISSQNYYFRWLYNLLSGMHLTDAIHDTEKKFPTQSWLVSTLTKKVFFRRN